MSVSLSNILYFIPKRLLALSEDGGGSRVKRKLSR